MTLVCIAFTTTTLKLKSASRYILRSFFNSFSLIKNFESLQALKYGSTNFSSCSKCCPLALTLHRPGVIFCIAQWPCQRWSVQSHPSGCFISAMSRISFWYTRCFMAFTVWHVMQCAVLLSQFCLSVCPSIRCVYCYKTK